MKFLLIPLIVILPVGLFSQSKPGKVEPGTSEETQIVRERTPNLARFYELLRRADRVVVIEESEEKRTQLFESANETDITELRTAVKLKLLDEWRWSICASPVVYFYKGSERLMSVSNVGGREVKTSVWNGNALLEDEEKWLHWFDRRGMPQLRAERDRDAEASKKIEVDEKRWYGAMPRGIRDEFEKIQSGLGLPPSIAEVKQFRPILDKEYPDRNVRILVLLNWFGSGAGPWSGYPSYESIAENILLTFTTPEILQAIDSRVLSSTETEGAARLFAGWHYYKQRPDDLRSLAPALRRRLIEHSLKTGDEDKRRRAKVAFEN